MRSGTRVRQAVFFCYNWDKSLFFVLALWLNLGGHCDRPHRPALRKPNTVGHVGTFGCAKDTRMETPKIGTITMELRLDWDRIGVLFVAFAIACTGIAIVVNSIGFLIQALTHHV
jgi:hypothetical protein